MFSVAMLILEFNTCLFYFLYYTYVPLFLKKTLIKGTFFYVFVVKIIIKDYNHMQI